MPLYYLAGPFPKISIPLDRNGCSYWAIPFQFVLSLCVLITLACHGSASAAYYIYTYCPSATSFPAANTAFRSNIDTLLSSLSASANLSSTPGFHNTSVGTGTSTSTVYGLYLCRGDDDPVTCRDCVAAASSVLSQNCPRGMLAVSWYDQCMVRYTNASTFSQPDINIYLPMWNTQNITGNLTRFNEVLTETLSEVTMEAASGSASLKFATVKEKLNDSQILYALGQCTPDLSYTDCYRCLQACIQYLPGGLISQGARVLFLSCNLRYEIYPFYGIESRLSSIHTYCPNTTLFPANNSAFRSNIDALLFNLSSTANQTTNPGFQTNSIGLDTPTSVYGLYLCRGDVSPATCRDCLASALVDLPNNCPLGKQAVILYDECMIRYSNESFFSQLDANLHPLWNVTEDAETSPDYLSMGVALGFAMEKIQGNEANVGADRKMFWTDNELVSANLTLYILGQCTPDLSPGNCNSCLQTCSNFLRSQPTVRAVYYFNCNLRYALYRFYQASPATQANTSLSPTVNNSSTAPSPFNPKPKNSTRHVPLIIITCSVTGVVLLFLVLALWLSVWRRKVKEAYTADLSDIANTESLQMDLNTIRAATHNFAIDRKLGQGGFGSVYKGTLENGQDIAVKRLSDSSRQGIIEFKAEVLLVSKLQHRNLVKLLGFCVSGKEIILVYEFLPNSSLDKILFDPTKRMSLNWETRFKIICGIAKGLMYLHEDSRLRVIHRDLKSSNILLDGTMNPKISDFGLAKLFSVDQTQDVTGSIAGTYGYMAPEYVLMGHYSIKSDVYSFGILVLEVVSGQRNKYLHSPLLEEALLYRAWRFWHEGEALKLVDDALGDNFSREDVMKCTHIGLLCIQESVAKRPNMTLIVAALGGQSITLPLPSPPNFFSNSNPTSTRNTKSSGVSAGKGISILDTSELTELHGR